MESRVKKIGAVFMTIALVSILGFIVLWALAASRSNNQNVEEGSVTVAGTESSLVKAADASEIKSETPSKNRAQTLIGTWVKERLMREGGDYPGNAGWHLSVTFDDNGQFIWDSKRNREDQTLVDESLTGTYSIERGFLITYKFDEPSSVSQLRLPEYFAFWPSKLTGQQTFKFYNDYLILGHDAYKLWFILKRNDDFRHVAQPDSRQRPPFGS